MSSADPLPPLGGLGQGAAQVDRESDRHDARVEEPAPSRRGHDDLVGEGGEHGADRVGRQQESGGAVAHGRRPGLHDVRRAGPVLARHADADDRAEDEQRPVVPGEPAQAAAEGEGEDGQDHRRFAAEVVADRAEDEPTQPAGHEGRGDECRGLGEGEFEVGGDLREDERDEDEVESVEQVAQPGGEERPALGAVEPAERIRGVGRRRCHDRDLREDWT